MENTHDANRMYNAIGWGSLCILWGVTLLFDFVPFGVGVLGTGLIVLGANVVRAQNGLPTRDNNTILGLLGLSWGGLELARPILQQLFRFSDWDWAIFAMLLVVLGLIMLVRELLRLHRAGVNNARLHGQE
jgi:hypothetical protein